MADVEDSSLLMRTILHGIMVTILLSVSLLAYLFIINYSFAWLVAEFVVYAAVGCLYIYNSSGWQKKIISAGYLVLVLSAFLLSPIGFDINYAGIIGKFVFGANMVALSTYCVWQLSSILPMLTNIVPIPLSLKGIIANILHAAIVAILLAVTIGFYSVHYGDDDDMHIPFLVQFLAYNAVGCLYMCNSPSQKKEKVVSAGFLVLLLLVFLLSSLANPNVRFSLIFAANMMAISSYCIWKLLYPLLQRWFDSLDGDDVAPVPRRQRAHRQEEEALLQVETTPFHIQEVLREFSSDEIQAMTQNFGSMIGRGGSAQVFRGNLDDGTPVAVKRINIHGGRTADGEEEFRRELSIIANVHHRSLVRLLGYCLQRGPGGLYLIYPFFENGSLDRWIFHGTDEQRRLLTWQKRLCIAIDVARALAYLHNECHWRILHLDVKPGNILLDGDLRAYVSDFGISLSITRGLNSVVDTEHLKGTFGYMAPEMLYNVVSDKSDVFSYGMTLLELIGGRRNMYPSSSETTDLTHDYFPYIVREKVKRGEVLEAVDGAMAPVGDEEAVKAVLMVALCCIQNKREMRPSMQTVVDMLEGRVAVDLPPESRHHLL